MNAELTQCPKTAGGRRLVCITGASGAIYGIRTIQALRESGCEVHTVASAWGERVVVEETGKPFSTWMNDFAVSQNQIYDCRDFAAPIASGSFPLDASVIVPCSMSSVGAIASGVCQNVIHRAALVCLKEARPLVIVSRESPLSLIDLRNLTTLAEAGATILPASPAFYHNPASMDDLVDFVVGKILDHLHVEHRLFKRWGSVETPSARNV
ncbi:MAG: UbiX family flavin prenyltransferase [Treponema sp.]|jgi:4-hydroxy-3-polyprenylbenzoate decarboxylase|nr:UbiX family flavin prenyltransferase [Treponema sp.]